MDGTIARNVTPAQDPSVLTGDTIGALAKGTLSDTATATGSLTITVPESGDSPSFADVSATARDNCFGGFERAAGAWSHTRDPSAVKGRTAGDTLQHDITFAATDGTTQTVSVSILARGSPPKFVAPTPQSHDADGTKISLSLPQGASDRERGALTLAALSVQA